MGFLGRLYALASPHDVFPSDVVASGSETIVSRDPRLKTIFSSMTTFHWIQVDAASCSQRDGVPSLVERLMALSLFGAQIKRDEGFKLCGQRFMEIFQALLREKGLAQGFVAFQVLATLVRFPVIALKLTAAILYQKKSPVLLFKGVDSVQSHRVEVQ